MSSILYIVCISPARCESDPHTGLAPFVYCIIVVIENGKCLPITAKEIELWLRWYSPLALWVYKTLNTI